MKIPFFSNLFSKKKSSPQKRNSFTDYLKWGFLSGVQSATDDSGEIVTIDKGSRITTVFACMNAISQDIAKLPFNVRKDTAKGKEVVKNNIYRLIHSRPNGYSTAFNFWYNVIWFMLSQGNAYIIIKRDSKLNPESLHILPPKEVFPTLINDELFYQYKDIIINGADMLHFKLYSFDGIVGVSPIIYNMATFGLSLKQDKYKAKILGSKPPGLLSFTQDLNPDQIDQNREMWKKMTQGDLGGTPVLSGGAKYQPFMVNAQDGQMIEASEMTDEHILSIFRVPPTVVQNYKRATFSNAEQQDLVYLKFTLTPILTLIEQECDNKLFKESNITAKEPFYTKFNIKGMLRGDIKTQVEYYRFMRDHGIMNADEIRALEDMNPLLEEQGQKVLVQGAMIPLDQLEDFYKTKSNGNSNSGD